MNLLDDLAAFLQEHRRCGLLDPKVTRGNVLARESLHMDEVGLSSEPQKKPHESPQPPYPRANALKIDGDPVHQHAINPDRFARRKRRREYGEISSVAKDPNQLAGLQPPAAELCANMSETVTPWEFNVEGEQRSKTD